MRPTSQKDHNSNPANPDIFSRKCHGYNGRKQCSPPEQSGKLLLANRVSRSKEEFLLMKLNESLFCNGYVNSNISFKASSSPALNFLTYNSNFFISSSLSVISGKIFSIRNKREDYK